jgi:hypothetical protein
MMDRNGFPISFITWLDELVNFEVVDENAEGI